VRPADGIGVLERQASLPVPSRPYHRQRAGPQRPRNAYVREDRILAHLPALHLLLTGPVAGQRRRRTRRGIDVHSQATAEHAINHLRENQIILSYDPASGTLRAGIGEAATTVTLKAG
jgi:hypothetical protein